MLRRALLSGTLAAAATTAAASLLSRRASSGPSFYEALGRGKHRSVARALLDGAAVSATAYVTDYYLVPRRLTPGFELRLPRRSLAGIYAALALGLAALDLLGSAQR